jgi:phosphoglucosamine mutase
MGFDIGIAFDGDADRCLCVDHLGNTVDGDRIMAICAMQEREAGCLPNDTFVATVMSNIGLHIWAKQNGLQILCASVGDRYVLEEMQKGGYMLGGEQSGHMIFKRHLPSGDGQLTALKLLSVMTKTKKSLAGLVSDIPLYPQVLLNVPVRKELKDSNTSHPEVAKVIETTEDILGGEGRILVRPSGTEALVRVMIEGKDETEITQLAEIVAGIIAKAD